MLDGITSHGIFKALVAIAGAFAFGFLAGMLPTFSYSGIVYGVVGVLLVVFGFHLLSKDGAGAYIGAFLIGFGVSMGLGLVSAVQSLVSPASSNAAGG